MKNYPFARLFEHRVYVVVRDFVDVIARATLLIFEGRVKMQQCLSWERISDNIDYCEVKTVRKHC